MQKRTEEGYRRASPFPKLDEFIKTQINKGGVQGVIRHWIHFQSLNLMLYDVDRNHWCDNVKRPHRSNHIYFIVDMGVKVFYQKCHDPDCHDFKSEERLLPDEVNPVLNDSEYIIDEFEDSSRWLCEAVEIAECEDSFMIEEKNNPKNTKRADCHWKEQNVENDRHRTSQDFTEYLSNSDDLTEDVLVQDSQLLSISDYLECDGSDFEDDIKSWNFNLSAEEGLAKSGSQNYANQMQIHDDAEKRIEKELDLFDAEEDFRWDDLDVENMSSVGNTESEFAGVHVSSCNISKSKCNSEDTTDLPNCKSRYNSSATTELSAKSFQKAPCLQLRESSQQKHFKSNELANELFSGRVNDSSSCRKTLRREDSFQSFFTAAGTRGKRASNFYSDEKCLNASFLEGKDISGIAERDMNASYMDEKISESLEEQLNKEFSLEIGQGKSHGFGRTEVDYNLRFREWRGEKFDDSTFFQETSEAVCDYEAVGHDCRMHQKYDVEDADVNSGMNSCCPILPLDRNVCPTESLNKKMNCTGLLNGQTHHTQLISSDQNVQSTPLLAKQNRAGSSVVRCELSDICLDDGLDEELLKLF